MQAIHPKLIMRIFGMGPRHLPVLFHALFGAQILGFWESMPGTIETLLGSTSHSLKRWTKKGSTSHSLKRWIKKHNIWSEFFSDYFCPKVRVTTTSYLEFYLSNFFSDLGGSLGLWLGVGILQVLVTQNVIDDSKSTIMIIFKCRYLSSCGKPSQPCPRYLAKKRESNNEKFSFNTSAQSVRLFCRRFVDY